MGRAPSCSAHMAASLTMTFIKEPGSGRLLSSESQTQKFFISYFLSPTPPPQSHSWVFSLYESLPSVFLKKRDIPQAPEHVVQSRPLGIDMTLSLSGGHCAAPVTPEKATSRHEYRGSKSQTANGWRPSLVIQNLHLLCDSRATLFLSLSFHLCILGPTSRPGCLETIKLCANGRSCS